MLLNNPQDEVEGIILTIFTEPEENNNCSSISTH